jgi:hypothetical protein
MSLVPIKKSTCSASAFDIRQQCRVYQYLKIYIGSLRQMSLQISIFEISSCVLSCFLGFSANLFLCFHFILQKTIKTESFKRSWDDGSGKWDKHTGSEGKSCMFLRNSSVIFAITNSANATVHLGRCFSLVRLIRRKCQIKLNKIITNVVKT